MDAKEMRRLARECLSEVIGVDYPPETDPTPPPHLLVFQEAPVVSSALEKYMMAPSKGKRVYESEIPIIGSKKCTMGAEENDSMSNAVKVRIEVSHSEAIKAGLSPWGPQVVTVDLAELTEEQRCALAEITVPVSYAEPYVLKWSSCVMWSQPAVGRVTETTVAELLDDYLATKARRAEERAAEAAEVAEHEAARTSERAARTAEALALLQEDGLELRASGYGVRVLGAAGTLELDLCSPGELRVARMNSGTVDLVTHDVATILERFRVQCEAGKVEAERVEAEKRAQRVTEAQRVVSTRGTENQRERHEAGCLPDGEVLEMLEAEAFEDIGLAPYESIKRGDLVHEEFCESGIAVSVEVATHLSAAQWDALKEAREALPEGGLAEVRSHHAACKADCGADPVIRYAVHVMVKRPGWGALTAKYACGN